MTDPQKMTIEDLARARGVSVRVYRSGLIIAKAALSAGGPMGDEQVDAVAGDVCAWNQSITETELREACHAAWREYRGGGRTFGYPGAGSITAFLRSKRNDAQTVKGPEDGEASPFKRAQDCKHRCRAGIVTMLDHEDYEVAVVCDCAGGGARRIRQPGTWGPSKGVSVRLAEGWGYLRDDPSKAPVSQKMADWVKAEVAKGDGVRSAARRWREWRGEQDQAKVDDAEWMR